jgi:O-antigen/teichoic acid export membrane protein
MSSTSTASVPALASTLARNTTWNYLGFAANVVVNLLLFPFVVAKVGDDVAGVWLLIGSLTGYMGLLELGIVPSLTQHVAGALGRRATHEINRAASTAFFLLLGISAVAFQLLWFLPGFVSLLSLPPGLYRYAQAMLAVAIAGFAARMPLAALQALLLGCQRQDRCNQLWLLLAVAKALATVGLLMFGFGMLAVVTMEAIAHLSAGVLQYRWVRHELPDLALSWRHADPASVWPLLSFGGTLMVTSLCSLVIEQTDRLVIAAFLPISEVTHYSAAFKLYALAVAVATTPVQAVAPLAGLLLGRGDAASLKALFLRMTKYTAGLAAPLVAALILVSGPVLGAWMGPRFIDARFVVQVLGVGFLATSFNHAGYSVLIGTRRIAPLLWRYFIPQALANLALSLWFVNWWGSVGVALGTTVPALLLQYAFLSYLLDQTGVRWQEFARAAVLPVCLPAGVAFVPVAVLALRVGPLSPLLVATYGICTLAYAVMFWYRSLTAAERQQIVAVLAQRYRARSLDTQPFSPAD